MNQVLFARQSILSISARMLVLLSFVLGCIWPVGAVSAETSLAPAGSKDLSASGASPKGMLNADGTLRLDGRFQGSLNLSGWDVQMDPQRGPIFRAQDEPQSLPSGAQWRNLGHGGSAIKGTVFVALVRYNAVYLGGNFTDANGDPTADYIVYWSGVSWSALGSNHAGNGSLNGAVYALAYKDESGIGMLYVGGAFKDVNNDGTVLNAADYLASWKGSAWSALGSGVGGDGSFNGAVKAIAVNGSTVYAGGHFTKVNNNGTDNTAAAYVARWNGSGWSALGYGASASSGSLNHPVYALALDGTVLYAGGNFTNVNNKSTVLGAADHFARWDGMNWSALGSTTTAAFNDDIRAILVNGTDIYVGGDFTDLAQGMFSVLTVDYVAKWNGTGWSGLGSNGGSNGALNGGVHALAMIGTDLYVGGAFTNVNNNGTSLPAADHIAKWDGVSWSALGDNGAGDGSLQAAVYAIQPYYAGLFVAGSFTNVQNGSQLIDYSDFATIWTPGEGWSAMSQTPTMGSLNGEVRAIVVSGSDVYVGGNFTDVSNRGAVIGGADYLAKWDGTDWSAVGGNGAGEGSLNGVVNALAIVGTKLYVGGEFTDVNDNGSVLGAADRIVEWSGGHWFALKGDGAGGGSLTQPVNALATDGTVLYVGGNFSDVKNGSTTGILAADYIAKWDGTNWSSLSSNGAPGEGSLRNNGGSAMVYAIAVSGSDVYVGGAFTDVNDGGTALTAADNIARWDGSHWHALGSNGASDGAITDYVFAIAVGGSTVYAGGDFENVNNNGTPMPEADYIAKWDGSNWSALGSNGEGDGAINSTVYSLAILGSDLYVGGRFNWMIYHGTAVPAIGYIARWSAGAWSAVGHGDLDSCDNYCGSLVGDIRAFAVQGSDLLVGGKFTGVNNNGAYLQDARRIAVFGDPGVAPPVVVSITRAGASPTLDSRIYFTLTFSRPVREVGREDFRITSTGSAVVDPDIIVSGATSSQDAVAVYSLGVDVDSGSGTVGVELVDDDSIVDILGNPLGGMSAGNGNFTTGETYRVGFNQIYLPLTRR